MLRSCGKLFAEHLYNMNEKKGVRYLLIKLNRLYKILL